MKQGLFTKKNALFIPIVLCLCLIAALFLTDFALAGPLKTSIKALNDTGAGGDLGEATSTKLPIVIGKLISALLGVLGIYFVIVILQAGFEYMTSNGSDDKVKEAKKHIVSSIIGMSILVGAYAISNYVISAIVTASGQSTATTPEGSSPSDKEDTFDPWSGDDSTGGSPGP
ncbi:MAG: pilin [Patescibacteria group bacterium]